MSKIIQNLKLVKLCKYILNSSVSQTNHTYLIDIYSSNTLNLEFDMHCFLNTFRIEVLNKECSFKNERHSPTNKL